MSTTEFDPLDTAGQERAKAEDKASKRIVLKNEEEDFKLLMGRKWGRRIMWRLLGDAGVFRASFNTNAMLMAFNEGNRNAGLKLLNQINTLCPEQYEVMTKENQNVRNDDGNAPNSN